MESIEGMVVSKEAWRHVSSDSGAQIYGVWAFTWIIKLEVIKYGSTRLSQA
jgi:hypothetical protein